MNKATTTNKLAAEPLLGEAALMQAMAEIAANPTAAGASDATQASASGKPGEAPPPKTVSQVLGEITWLMTQSPRHNRSRSAISNGW